MAKQITDRCPHAKNCWKGGGSYKCVTTPPFCKKPLFPKNNDGWQKLELPRIGNNGVDKQDGETEQVPVIQQELF